MSARKLFWDQGAAEGGDNPYFPEFVSTDPREWRAIYEPGYWYVYVLYTDHVRRHPVYVGMTSDISRRLAQHKNLKPWWPLVHRIIVDRCGSKDEARPLEERFIHRTQPLFNVVSNLHTVEVT